MKKFALVGAAGYIASRHMKAIKDTGNVLLAALDKTDSVGIIDSYFPDAHFFTEFERFDRHIDKQRRSGNKIDYVSICTPNYLHDSHIRFALKQHADAICEKPLVLNPWNIDALQEIEQETQQRIFNIFQLRLHPKIQEWKKRVEEEKDNKIYDIDLTYITPRGNWYFVSWKGDVSKSGGIATNIGVHFFDMLTWIFGNVKRNVVNYSDQKTTAGFLLLEKARVRWILSLDINHVPPHIRATGQKTYRAMTANGENIEFSDGFTDLHTESYRQILEGNGFPLSSARNCIETVYAIRNSSPVGLQGDYHPLLKEIKTR